MSRTGSNLFLVSLVDLPRSDRIWKCLPDVAGDRLQFVQNDSEGCRFFFLFSFFLFQTERKKNFRIPHTVNLR